MQTRNVGTVDAYIRIVLGLAALTWVSIGRAGRWSTLAMMLGAMKVAEGITRFSPLLAALGTSTLERLADEKGQGSFTEHTNKHPLPNPLLPE